MSSNGSNVVAYLVGATSEGDQKLGAGKTTLLVSAHFRYFSVGCFSIWQAILT